MYFISCLSTVLQFKSATTEPRIFRGYTLCYSRGQRPLLCRCFALLPNRENERALPPSPSLSLVENIVNKWQPRSLAASAR